MDLRQGFAASSLQPSMRKGAPSHSQDEIHLGGTRKEAQTRACHPFARRSSRLTHTKAREPQYRDRCHGNHASAPVSGLESQ